MVEARVTQKEPQNFKKMDDCDVWKKEKNQTHNFHFCYQPPTTYIKQRYIVKSKNVEGMSSKKAIVLLCWD